MVDKNRIIFNLLVSIFLWIVLYLSDAGSTFLTARYDNALFLGYESNQAVILNYNKYGLVGIFIPTYDFGSVFHVLIFLVGITISLIFFKIIEKGRLKEIYSNFLSIFILSLAIAHGIAATTNLFQLFLNGVLA